MLSDGAITLFDNMTAADAALLLGAIGTFLTTITGLFVKLAGLKAGQEVIRKDVNSNMTDANNRIEELHGTISQMTSDKRDVDEAARREPVDVNLKILPTDEESHDR